MSSEPKSKMEVLILADRPSSSRLVDILWGLSIKRCQVGLCVPCGADGSVRLQCLWDAHQTPSLALNRRGGVRLGTVPSRSAAPEVTLPPLKKSPPILEPSLSHSASAAEALGFIGLAAREPCGANRCRAGSRATGMASSPLPPALFLDAASRNGGGGALSVFTLHMCCLLPVEDSVQRLC